MKYIQSFGLIGILVSGLFLTAPSAEAGILLEPYMTYEVSTVNATTGGQPDGGKNNGAIGIGGRIGYKLIIPVWIAADISQVSGKYKPDLPGSDLTFTRSNTYLTVGFDFPILFRAWAGMGLSNSTKVSDASTDVTVSGGSNMKVGVGLGLIPFMSVNLEYFTSKPTLPTDYSAYDETGFALGVSVPFNL